MRKKHFTSRNIQFVLQITRETIFLDTILAPETSDTASWEDVVRQRPTEGAKISLREAVSSGDHVGLVGDTLGALGHAVVGQQLTPPY